MFKKLGIILFLCICLVGFSMSSINAGNVNAAADFEVKITYHSSQDWLYGVGVINSKEFHEGYGTESFMLNFKKDNKGLYA